jgi:NTP pyrophosphatase (non-canonical NTP hydrolase)
MRLTKLQGEAVNRLAERVGGQNLRDEFIELTEELGEYAKEIASGDRQKQAEELADLWLGATVMLRAFYPDVDLAPHLTRQIERWSAKHELPVETSEPGAYVLIKVVSQDDRGYPTDYHCLAGPTPHIHDVYSQNPVTGDDLGDYRIVKASPRRELRTVARWSPGRERWYKETEPS